MVLPIGRCQFSEPHFSPTYRKLPEGRYDKDGSSFMTRAEFVQRLILNSMCDDFENVDHMILPDVAGVAARCGLTIERPEVVEVLRGLVEAGLAKAYDLSASGRDPFAGELPGIPPLDVVEEYFRTYFYVTKKGMEFHKASDKWWPFDDEGALRPDWRPPAP